MIKEMDLEFFIGQMEITTKEIGKTIKFVVRVILSINKTNKLNQKYSNKIIWHKVKILVSQKVVFLILQI